MYKPVIFVTSIFFCISCSHKNNEESTNTKTESQQLEFNLAESCNYSGEEHDGAVIQNIYTFKSDQEAEDALNKIMKNTGLPANFELIATDLDNAAAVIREKKRYILYSQKFMEEAKTKTKSEFGPISILAHEIGHHLSGHTLLEGGSRPNLELDADRFSGFILAKLGADMNEACAAINEYGSNNATRTHPSKKSRIAAIINGWKLGKAESMNIGVETQVASPDMGGMKYIVDVEGGYITLRNRSLSPEEIKVANSGTKNAELLNKETIITNIYNGTQLEVLSTTGNTFYIRANVQGTNIEGYIAKKFRGISTIRNANSLIKPGKARG